MGEFIAWLEGRLSGLYHKAPRNAVDAHEVAAKIEELKVILEKAREYAPPEVFVPSVWPLGEEYTAGGCMCKGVHGIDLNGNCLTCGKQGWEITFTSSQEKV